MMTRPFPIGYALAREYFELWRSHRGGSHRTHAAQQARGGMRAIAGVASSSGLVSPGSARFESLAGEVAREIPFEPGPEWLDRASTELAARLER